MRVFDAMLLITTVTPIMPSFANNSWKFVRCTECTCTVPCSVSVSSIHEKNRSKTTFIIRTGSRYMVLAHWHIHVALFDNLTSNCLFIRVDYKIQNEMLEITWKYDSCSMHTQFRRWNFVRILTKYFIVYMRRLVVQKCSLRTKDIMRGEPVLYSFSCTNEWHKNETIRRNRNSSCRT